MSLIDELRSALGAAEGMLAALGPKPKGDPAGMRALAAAIRNEAGALASTGSGASGLPGSIDFHGPAAQTLAANAAGVGGVVSSASGRLESIASRVTEEAAKIERKQHEWEREQHRLQQLVSSLGVRMQAAGR